MDGDRARTKWIVYPNQTPSLSGPGKYHGGRYVIGSFDGRRFTVDPRPTLLPEYDYEVFGIEDPRITFIDGWYYFNYSAISPNGVTTCLARTKDFA